MRGTQCSAPRCYAPTNGSRMAALDEVCDCRVIIAILYALCREALNALDDRLEGAGAPGGDGEKMDVDDQVGGLVGGEAMSQDRPPASAGPGGGVGAEGQGSGAGSGGVEGVEGPAGGGEEALEKILESTLDAVMRMVNAEAVAADEKELLNMASKLGKAVDKVMPADMRKAKPQH